MQALRRLSLVNVRITAAPAFEQCTVDIDAIASYMGRPASKLSSTRVEADIISFLLM